MNAIVSHTNMDFDSLAAMVAAQKLHPKAKIILPNTSSANVRRFLAIYQGMIDEIDLDEVDPKSVKEVILVDTRSLQRIGEAAKLIEGRKVDLIIYDHHPKSKDDIDFGLDLSREAGSTVTLLVLRIKEQGVSITSFEASLFALGIHEDTGSLTHQNSTADDAKALAFLLERGADLKVVSHFLKSSLTDEQHELLKLLLGLAKKEDFMGASLMIIEAALGEYIEDASVVVRKIAELEDIDLIFLIMKVGEKEYVIARSRLDEVDVGRIMQKFGGGGHANVGSAVVKNRGIKEIKRIIKSEIKKEIKGAPTAEKIMSKPVVTIALDETVSEAGRLMARYGFDGLPVVHKGSYLGMILRRDVDKATHHGLGHAPVKGFLSSPKISASPQMLASEVERIMTERSIARLPVLDGERVVGIITRSNIITSLRGEKGAERLSSDALFAANKREIVRLMSAALTKSSLKLIKEIGMIADSEGLDCYLVGGFVRDLMLKRANLDIDIVVEGDALLFVEKVVKKVGGKIKMHKKFKTAILITKDGLRVDFASARFEQYDYPAALPRVEPSSIIYDLSRRDFTINSMAVKINREDFGELLDPFGGVHDLGDGKLKTLHALSFIEDPTRIFRAVRFESRFGSRLDHDTELLAKKASELKVIERLSQARLTYELIEVLSEEDPLPLLSRLLELGALIAVHPHIKLGQRKRRLFMAIKDSQRELTEGLEEKPKLWVVNLMALVHGLSEADLSDLMLRLDLARGDRDALTRTLREAPLVQERLSKAKIKDSEIFLALEGRALEELVFLYAFSDQKRVKERIALYLSELLSVKPLLSGRDLIALGFKESPLYNLVLKKLLLLRLDNRNLSRDEEVELAKDLFEREAK